MVRWSFNSPGTFPLLIYKIGISSPHDPTCSRSITKAVGSTISSIFPSSAISTRTTLVVAWCIRFQRFSMSGPDHRVSERRGFVCVDTIILNLDGNHTDRVSSSHRHVLKGQVHSLARYKPTSYRSLGIVDSCLEPICRRRKSGLR